MHYFLVGEAAGKVSGLWVLAKQGAADQPATWAGRRPSEWRTKRHAGEVRGCRQARYLGACRAGAKFWCGGDGYGALAVVLGMMQRQS